MSRHRYPFAALAADYGRATAGLALTAGPIVLADAAPVVVYILAALASLFALYGLRTILHHLSSVEISDEAIEMTGPAGGMLRWRDLNAMTLKYYSTKKDRQGGWMQLKLSGSGRTIKLDSTIGDFPRIVGRALFAARANSIALGDSTTINLTALGLTAAEPTPDPR
jgi:hypothetical protein